jgi:hypothetical protein
MAWFIDSLIQCYYNLHYTVTHTYTSVHSHVFSAAAWERLPTTNVPLPLGSRTVLGLGYQLLTATARNNWTAAQSSKLLLALVSTVVLGFGPSRDPWPYFCSFQTFMFWNGAFFSKRGGVWLLLLTSIYRGVTVGARSRFTAHQLSWGQTLEVHDYRFIFVTESLRP